MTADSGWIAVDWGTTNRRVFVIDAQGEVTDRFIDGAGVTAILPGEFPAVIEQLRERCGDAPKLLAGMIGSNRGWIEAPYVDCPATIGTIVEALVPAREDVRIVPGVCDRNQGRADVMRGEEVQLLGALSAGMIAPDAAACHPGTHAKWARLEGGAIAAFRTVMTGEMFAMLGKHSLLAAPLSGPVTPGAAFQEGVARAFERRELMADLFAVRARILLGTMAPEDTASFGSGLLIGSDVAIGLDFVGSGPVALIGEPALTRLYACALAQAGRQSQQIDGEAAFIAGIKAIAGRL
ncbi:MAG TPA: 2-dehydro-3-deoxygalactonokinase [Sphingomonas sp.]|nr:2-dehydro-3-deoxygalactonokinase [Sphingomonas sp.]